jgi:hypothetical protein
VSLSLCLGRKRVFERGSKGLTLSNLRFYYADERKPNGGYAIPVSGEAAGEFYPELAEGTEQGPWEQTFVKGKGYVKF